MGCLSHLQRLFKLGFLTINKLDADPMLGKYFINLSFKFLKACLLLAL